MKMNDVIYRKARDGDEARLFSLVEDGFHEFVEPDLTQEGTTEFFRAARQMIFNRDDNHLILIAKLGKEIIGMIVVRNDGHICLFFVNQKFQGKGIGRVLLEMAESEIDRKNDMDVHSSLFAVKAYEKLGFVKTEGLQTSNGIKFVPMKKQRT